MAGDRCDRHCVASQRSPNPLKLCSSSASAGELRRDCNTRPYHRGLDVRVVQHVFRRGAVYWWRRRLLKKARAGLAIEVEVAVEAENAVLRHQVIILRRRLHGRIRLANHDRWFFIQPYRWFPSILEVLTIIRPETLVRWHRAGFRCYWRWKSRRRGGRPQIDTELRALIRRMSIENPLGARRASTANYSSSGLRSRSRVSPNTCSSDAGGQARDGAPFCVIMPKISPPWTCLLFRPSASTCSTPTS